MCVWGGGGGVSAEYFSYFSMKTYIVVLIRSAALSASKEALSAALLMITHNICFCGDIRKKYQ